MFIIYNDNCRIHELESKVNNIESKLNNIPDDDFDHWLVADSLDCVCP